VSASGLSVAAWRSLHFFNIITMRKEHKVYDSLMSEREELQDKAFKAMRD
jgi:hypothetical protein